MERRPRGTNRNSKSRRIPYRNIEELETGKKDNERSSKEHKEVIQ